MLVLAQDIKNKMKKEKKEKMSCVSAAKFRTLFYTFEHPYY